MVDRRWESVPASYYDYFPGDWMAKTAKKYAKEVAVALRYLMKTNIPGRHSTKIKNLPPVILYEPQKLQDMKYQFRDSCLCG